MPNSIIGSIWRQFRFGSSVVADQIEQDWAPCVLISEKGRLIRRSKFQQNINVLLRCVDESHSSLGCTPNTHGQKHHYKNSKRIRQFNLVQNASIYVDNEGSV